MKDEPALARHAFAVPVKLWALFCSILGVSVLRDVRLTGLLIGFAFVYLAVQGRTGLVVSYGLFDLVLALLLIGIRRYGLRMVIFSEFYVLMFWQLSAAVLVSWDLITTPPGALSAFLARRRAPTALILGLLVIFRFFPTMKAEWQGVGRSMKNRGLTGPVQLIAHPLASLEYVMVPLLLRVLQIADQLAVSAVARGAECPGVRSSYVDRPMGARDWAFAALWAAVPAGLLAIGPKLIGPRLMGGG